MVEFLDLPMIAGSTISVGVAEKAVWVRVCGKGSFQNSPGLKEFAKEMINRGHRDFSIDLSGCPVMDSTFMGTMTGIALRLRELGQGRLRVVNPNTRNAELLTGLGLDHLIALERGPVSVPCETSADPMAAHNVADKRDLTQTMVHAHEALCGADGKNVEKFKDVLEYLKENLHRQDVATSAN